MIKPEESEASDSEEEVEAYAAGGDDVEVGRTDEEEAIVPEIRRIQIGRPVGELSATAVLQNQRVQVGEQSSQAVFRAGEKLWEESRERRYEVVFLRAGTSQGPQRPTPLHRVEGGVAKEQMSQDELAKLLVGRVKKITETINETTYHGGMVSSKRETRTEFCVDVVAGVDETQRI